MILVDTGIWVDHLRKGDKTLIALLEQRKVLVHAFVRGELACGNLQNRKQVLGLMQDLPQIAVATDEEVMYFIESRKVMGKGIGYIDAHLLASAALETGAALWTRDMKLHAIAHSLGLGYSA